ncbi:preprotein translocase subunit YajC [Aurantiacibacter gangjinensis]|uniref:Sec translocon accessory complex subunit YajC n=1 Tax=Aurantiacibacter gangjinensis TaxID=502682 RepID=A0A0G9MR22_9SPHN|nr:preprotein translocase subunit YajC [Aurantiacibacter gangjinensis]APE29066.1 Preprotein translocase subunit YajC [Aurantiacibacter gangjinensis]KLE33157.1 preprotein translocase subunit YajC [Aurantiacibacter gangjinensis]
MLDFFAASTSQSGGGLLGFVPIIGMILIFWFLLFRPQMKRAKEHQEKVASLKKNDKVVTAGGIVGKVTKVDDDYAEVEIAQGTRIKVVKSTIGDIIAPGGKAAND